MKKLGNIIIVFGFLFILFFIPIGTKLKKNQTFSVYENRAYAAFPALNRETLFSGQFVNGVNDYFTDHVIGRNTVLKAYARLNMDVLKKTVVNDVVITPEVLLSYHESDSFDKNAIDEKTAHMVSELSSLNGKIEEYGGCFLYVGIPEQYSVFYDKFPDYLASEHEMLLYTEKGFFEGLEMAGVPVLKMRDILFAEGNVSEKYSSMDHHFNYYGAFDIYGHIIKSINEITGSDLIPLTKADIEFEELPQRFLGSRNRKLYDNYPNDEKVIIGRLKDPVEFSRYDNGEERESSVYSLPAEDAQFVNYNVYMGGDIANTVIKTNRPELPDLLIFGDSFTNPVETLLYQNFNTTHSLDLRYYTEDDLYGYIDKFQPDIVLCIRDDTAYLSTDGNGRFRRAEQ